MKKQKKFNPKVLLILAILYVIFSIFSFFVEMKIAGMKYDIALFMRITALILDVFFIVSGLLTRFQVKLRKVLRKQKIFARKPKLIVWTADTTSIMVFFFILYYVRLEICFQMELMTKQSFIIGLILSLGINFIFGALFQKIIKGIKRFLNKRLS